MNVHLEQLQNELQPIAPIVHDSLQAAWHDMSRRVSLFGSPDRQWLRADLFRASLGDHLSQDAPFGWSLDKNERIKHRGALLLHDEARRIQIRLQRIASDGTLPEARSDSRRTYYENTDFDVVDLEEKCYHKLVLTYVENVAKGTFEARIIRPHRHLSRTYSVKLPNSAELFTKKKFEVENQNSYAALFGTNFGSNTGTDQD